MMHLIKRVSIYEYEIVTLDDDGNFLESKPCDLEYVAEFINNTQELMLTDILIQHLTDDCYVYEYLLDMQINIENVIDTVIGRAMTPTEKEGRFVTHVIRIKEKEEVTDNECYIQYINSMVDCYNNYRSNKVIRDLYKCVINNCITYHSIIKPSIKNEQAKIDKFLSVLEDSAYKAGYTLGLKSTSIEEMSKEARHEKDFLDRVSEEQFKKLRKCITSCEKETEKYSKNGTQFNIRLISSGYLFITEGKVSNCMNHYNTDEFYTIATWGFCPNLAYLGRVSSNKVIRMAQISEYENKKLHWSKWFKDTCSKKEIIEHKTNFFNTCLKLMKQYKDESFNIPEFLMYNEMVAEAINSIVDNKDIFFGFKDIDTISFIVRKTADIKYVIGRLYNGLKLTRMKKVFPSLLVGYKGDKFVNTEDYWLYHSYSVNDLVENVDTTNRVYEDTPKELRRLLEGMRND